MASRRSHITWTLFTERARTYLRVLAVLPVYIFRLTPWTSKVYKGEGQDCKSQRVVFPFRTTAQMQSYVTSEALVSVKSLANLYAAPMTGRVIRLEPLTLDHAPELFELAKEPSIWEYMTDETPTSIEEARARIRAELKETIPFAIRMRASGEFAGCIDYREIQPENESVEVGWVWVGLGFRGTLAGPEALYLMTGNAFDEHGAGRVWTETDARNKGSNGSLRRFGYVFEGCLRRHLRLSNGFIRDTNLYSVTVDDWPAMKARVEDFWRKLSESPADDWRIVAAQHFPGYVPRSG